MKTHLSRHSATLFACFLLLVSFAQQASGDVRTKIEADATKYLQAWTRSDYKQMYSLLSAQTKREMAEKVFISRMRTNTNRFARVVQVVDVRVATLAANEREATVSYELETIITEEQAAKLRNLGNEKTRAGLHRSQSTRKFVLERGIWRMFIRVRNSDGKGKSGHRVLPSRSRSLNARASA